MKPSLQPLLAMMAMTHLGGGAEIAASPISLHPDNPSVFLFRNTPTLLITSGEHYGAVLNLDFDYDTYLTTLAADGLNATRTFVGAYCEPVGAFNIARNSLAPAAGRLICPWARSTQPGYANGGAKFDLSAWDEDYFVRLRDFVGKAGEVGIVVEVNLFCPFYGDEMWVLSPLNAANNTNGLGVVGRQDVYTLDRSGGLLPIQEAMTRRIVTELKDFDNVVYEIMNEPYICNVPKAWEQHLTDIIVSTEKVLGVRHMISLNVANGREKIATVPPGVSLLNFHYAWPPDTIDMNHDLGCAIGDNETGFNGTGDFHYRREGWAFIMAGGAFYNHLDYSFTAGHEDGTFAFPSTQPGGGGKILRRQLGILSRFMHSLDLPTRTSRNELLATPLPDGLYARIVGCDGGQVAVYLCRTASADGEAQTTLNLTLPAGRYRAHWLDPLAGTTTENVEPLQSDGMLKLQSPSFREDIAVRLVPRDTP